MRSILLVNTNFGFGGVETFYTELAKRYEQRGFNVEYLSLMNLYPLLKQAGVPAEKITVVFPELADREPGFLQTLRRLPRIYRALRRRPYEAIFTSLHLPALPLWVLRLFNRSLPVYFLVLQTSEWFSRHKYLWHAGLVKWASRKIITPSDYIRRDYTRRFRGYDKAIVSFRLPVDTERFRPRDRQECRALLGLPQDKTIIGATARLAAAKDISLFIRTIAAIEDDHVMGVVFGNGPLEEQLRRQIASLGLSDRMLLLPPRHDVENVYGAFDLYLQTSEGPNLGLSVLEAFASGLPVLICTRSEQEVDMAEDTLLGSGAGEHIMAEPEAVATAALRMLRTDLQAQYREAARALALRSYQWEVFLNSLITLHGTS